MARLIMTELFKLRKRQMTWILLYVLMGIMVVLYLILFAITRISLPPNAQGHMGDLQDILGLPLAIPFALNMLASFGTVLAVILIASSVGNEYNWGTIRIALISSESRFKFLAAKIISAIIVILVGMVIGVITGLIMSMITTAIGGYSFDFGFFTGQYAWDQFLQFWRTLFIGLPYIMIAFLFAVLGRSAMPGIAVGIGVAFLESIITALMYAASGWVAKIPDYLFTANVNAINNLAKMPSGFFSDGGFGNTTNVPPSIPHAFAVLAIYIIVFTVIGFWLFRKRDVTG
jgi:ABC-2 type transport system permease protein